MTTCMHQISRCIYAFLGCLRAQLIHFGHLILFLTHHSESQIMFEGFKDPSEVIKAEDQVKIKQKLPHAAHFPMYLQIYIFLGGFKAWLIHFGHQILFLTHHSELQMIMEGFKSPSEVINAENQVKIKQKQPHSANIFQ